MSQSCKPALVFLSCKEEEEGMVTSLSPVPLPKHSRCQTFPSPSLHSCRCPWLSSRPPPTSQLPCSQTHLHGNQTVSMDICSITCSAPHTHCCPSRLSQRENSSLQLHHQHSSWQLQGGADIKRTRHPISEKGECTKKYGNARSKTKPYIHLFAPVPRANKKRAWC